MYEIHTMDVPGKGVSIWENGKKVAEILNVGATLNYLDIDQSGNIIEGYINQESFSSFDWSRSAILFPFPNRLRDGRYRFEEQEYQFPINEPAHHNALHGFVFEEEFKLQKQDLEQSRCSLKFLLDYQGDRSYYPFPFTMEVTYEVSGNQLKSFFTIHNTGAGALPFGFGWHPYFSFGETVGLLEMQLPTCSQLLLDDRQLPTGNKVPYAAFKSSRAIEDENLDTGFEVGQSMYSVSLKTLEGRELALIAENQPYLQVFIPPHRQSIAIEPMSSGIDVFNSKEGLQVLEPGNRTTFTTTIKLATQ